MESYADALRREILIALLHHPETVVVVSARGELQLLFSEELFPAP